jgi:type IV secretory pathway VirB3-like protein
LTEKEPHWMSIYITKLTRCSPIQNRAFWKSNSYKP